jgi:hypothetical protein
MAIPQNVVGGCCIPTTILRGSKVDQAAFGTTTGRIGYTAGRISLTWLSAWHFQRRKAAAAGAAALKSVTPM